MGSGLDPFKLTVKLCPEDLYFMQHLLTLVSHSHMSAQGSITGIYVDSWDLFANNFTFESAWRKLIVKEDLVDRA